MNRDSIELGHVLAAYAESRLASSLVLFIGDTDSGVAERLLDQGARQVHAFDRDAARARRFSEHADRRIVARPLPHKFEVRDAAFDVAIVVDMASVADPEALARELARLVKDDGVVIAATRNGDANPVTARGAEPRAIPYEAFYDLFAVAFEHVRVAAKAPWRGAVLAELGERGEDPEVTVDSALAPDPPTPTHFVIVASQTPTELDAYALYQLPLLDEEEEREEQVEEEEEEEEEDEVDSYEEHGPISQSETVAGPRAEAAAAAAIEFLQNRARADAAANEIAELRRINDAQTLHLKELLEERARHAVVAANLERVGADLAHAEIELKKAASAQEEHARALAHAVEQSAEEHAAELANIEMQLRERARAVVELEREVTRRERIVRELVASLEEAQRARESQATTYSSAPLAPSPTIEPPPLPPTHIAAQDLEKKLAAVAFEMARYEGELLARDWRIAELEQNLAIADSAVMDSVASPADGSARRVAELEMELDTLRRAFAQEHQEKTALARTVEELASKSAPS